MNCVFIAALCHGSIVCGFVFVLSGWDQIVFWIYPPEEMILIKLEWLEENSR